MANIISGRYCGPIEHFQGERGLLLSNSGRAIPEGTQDVGQLVKVQWDDLYFWEDTVEKTGTGWEKHRFRDFEDFYLTSFEDMV